LLDLRPLHVLSVEADEVTEVVNNSLTDLPREFCKDGFDMLIMRYRKCIALGGEYVEWAQVKQVTSDEEGSHI
jgi:hypothetical protein